MNVAVIRLNPTLRNNSEIQALASVCIGNFFSLFDRSVSILAKYWLSSLNLNIANNSNSFGEQTVTEILRKCKSDQEMRAHHRRVS